MTNYSINNLKAQTVTTRGVPCFDCVSRVETALLKIEFPRFCSACQVLLQYIGMNMLSQRLNDAKNRYTLSSKANYKIACFSAVYW